MKKWWIGAGVVVAIGVTVFATYLVAGSTQPTTSPSLTLGDGVFAMRVARTNDEHTRGLSGTTELPGNEALVFDFFKEDRWGIWMKDMNYPIDIIWLNASKEVSHLVENVQPNSYPQTTYTPPDPARYVIELKAGVVNAKRITIGTQAVFDSTKGTFE